jgi:2-phospho-L-lactate/phosphoenolpyruvate guanylyltransferase
MSDRSVWAVVPVKPFAAAKQRLSPVLSHAERAELARLMLWDVLDVLAACTTLCGILVVTLDDAAKHIAAGGGAMVLDDPVHDLNGAVRTAIDVLSTRPHAGMIVVPTDVPLLSPSVLDDLIDRISRPPAVALVPASRDGGTNLLACSPAGAIDPRFGPDSSRRHCQLAHSAGIVPSVLASQEAGLDIDRPEDLAALLSRRPETRSLAFLATLDIGTRLQRNPAPDDAARQFLQA